MELKFYKQYFFILLFFCLFSNNSANSSKLVNLYSKKSISNYFSGVLSSKNSNTTESLNFFNKVKDLSGIHDPFIKKYLLTLVEEQKVDDANDFLLITKSKFLEAHIISGTKYFFDKKYNLAIENFELVSQNANSSSFDILIAKTLINYLKVFQNKEIKDNSIFKNIPINYNNFTIINEALINCYLDVKVDESFLKLLDSERLDYSRYAYFYVNYLFSKKRYNDANNIIKKNYDILDYNILLDQSKLWINQKRPKEINKLFDCKNPKHVISEFFYVIANLYATQELYKKSNFYLSLSLYLNPKFKINQTQLASNYFHLEAFERSKNIYKKFEKKNTIFYWYASKRIFLIDKKLNKDKSLKNLIKDFDKIKNPNLKVIFDMANIYKNSDRFKESIDYYTKVIKELDYDHPMYADILYRRGASYERIGMWKESDKDLLDSLKIKSDDPYVLNYLGYSWLERNYKIKEAMEMLLLANNKSPEDPYIADSVGWAYYLQGEYTKAEIYIKKAIQLLPGDPIISDHYGDILWKLNKFLQANYFWNYVLNLEDTKLEIRNKIKDKLIFGIQNLS